MRRLAGETTPRRIAGEAIGVLGFALAFALAFLAVFLPMEAFDLWDRPVLVGVVTVLWLGFAVAANSMSGFFSSRFGPSVVDFVLRKLQR